VRQTNPYINSIVTDPTLTLKGQDLTRRDCSIFSRLRTRRCGRMLYRCGLTETPACDFEANNHSIGHNISNCLSRACEWHHLASHTTKSRIYSIVQNPEHRPIRPETTLVFFIKFLRTNYYLTNTIYALVYK